MRIILNIIRWGRSRVSSQYTPETLYVAHYGWLQRWLFRKLRCAQDAADLTQDTFLRVLAGTRATQQLREPKAYLRVIAGGLVVDHYRRRALETAYLEALSALPAPQAPSVEAREVMLESLQQLDAALDRLPARARRVFLLSQLEGLTYATIAARIGVSERTVKRDMRRGFSECLALML